MTLKKESSVPPLPASTLNPMLVEEQSAVQDQNPQKKSISKPALFALIAIVACFLVILFTVQPSTPPPENIQFQPSADVRTTFVHLFEWKWTDIEKECVNFLGPMGYSAVQVSPPNEHANHKNIPENPWWARYQPVSYKLESRSGTRQEFINMVNTCKSVGVEIYVDAVLNHMAAYDTGTGNAGTPFNAASRSYAVFGPNDFNYCNPPDIQGSDYSGDAYRVRHCQLVGLPDLKQDSDYVRSVQAAFLQDMMDIGVTGFRFDAGKHMEPNDINAILAKVNGDPYVFLEVIDYGFESVSVNEYTPFQDVTEFRYEVTLVDKFASGQIASLFGIGESFGFVGTTSAVVFVDNHDTQRYSDAKLTYRNGALYDIANVFMLAWPYGYPKVMSSYAFNNNEFNRGPPSVNGDTKSVYNADGSDNCFGEWVCEHRWRPIANMVGFKNYAASQGAYEVQNWWTNNFQAIAFSRAGPNGVAGFVVINKETFSLQGNVYFTGLPDGVYCDVVNGDFSRSGCSGRTVSVRDGGYVQVDVAPFSAFAIHGGARL